VKVEYMISLRRTLEAVARMLLRLPAAAQSGIVSSTHHGT
jgi:hypothetical protein